MSNNTFTIAARHLWNLALTANDNGDFFPLWVRVCLVLSFAFAQTISRTTRHHTHHQSRSTLVIGLIFVSAININVSWGVVMKGTCMGFQLLNVLAGGPSVLTSGFNSENLPLPLTFTPAANSSQLFSSYPAYLVEAVQTGELRMSVAFCSQHYGQTCQRTSLLV